MSGSFFEEFHRRVEGPVDGCHDAELGASTNHLPVQGINLGPFSAGNILRGRGGGAGHRAPCCHAAAQGYWSLSFVV